MGKNITIRKFQTARLDEWVGDYSSADLAYEEIQKSNVELSYILEKTIEKRKAKLFKNPQTNDNMMSCIAQTNSSTKLLHPSESFKYMRELDSQPNNESMKWKYSVTIISKVDNDLRLEIRGYNPEGNKPNLSVEIPKEMKIWSTQSSPISFEAEVILLEIIASSRDKDIVLYISIDQWGLLCGSIIINENNLEDVLININDLLNAICGLIW